MTCFSLLKIQKLLEPAMFLSLCRICSGFPTQLKCESVFESPLLHTIFYVSRQDINQTLLYDEPSQLQ